MRLWKFYGQTGVAPLATVLKPGDQLHKPGSAGRPALNVETRVVDEPMNDVKPGDIGEGAVIGVPHPRCTCGVDKQHGARGLGSSSDRA